MKPLLLKAYNEPLQDCLGSCSYDWQ